MNTVNISLTSAQVKLVDSLTDKLGFASRSEFFRALLRRIIAEPVLKKEIQSWPFVSPPIKSSKEIVTAFKKTGKYSEAFLKDLTEGLQNSSYFSE